MVRQPLGRVREDGDLLRLRQARPPSLAWPLWSLLLRCERRYAQAPSTAPAPVLEGMTLAVCPTCLTPQPRGHRCGAGVERDRVRRQHRSNVKGYKSSHWQKIRRAAIGRDGGCVVCGSMEDLTVDYDGDHSRALLSDTVTLCRTHHGSKDGGRVEGRFFENGR